MATFNTYAGVVYYNFDFKGTVRRLQNPETGIIHIGQDFNFLPQSAVVAQVDRSGIHIFDEIRMMGSSTDDVVEEIKYRYPNSKVVVYPDPAGRQRKTSAGGKTDLSILVNAGFDVKVRNSHTAVRDRINAVNALLKSAQGQRRLFVDPRCKHTIESLQRLTYIEGTHQVDKTSGLDHMADSVGYLVDYLFPIRKHIEEQEPQRWSFGGKRSW
jgi:hypothetical protein